MKPCFSTPFRCGIVSEGDFEVRENGKSEGGGSTENQAIEEQSNHDVIVELAFEEQLNNDVELAGEDEAGIEFHQVVMDLV